jgi:hypothetical protein
VRGQGAAIPMMLVVVVVVDIGGGAFVVAPVRGTADGEPAATKVASDLTGRECWFPILS